MAAKTHITKLKAIQSKILRTIINVSQYVRNNEIRKDLIIRTIAEKITR